MPLANLPVCCVGPDTLSRVTHRWPFSLCAVISSFAPPAPDRLVIDAWGPNVWHDAAVLPHRAGWCPRSLPDPMGSEWVDTAFPELFLFALIPSSVPIAGVLAKVTISLHCFSGVIAVDFSDRSQDEWHEWRRFFASTPFRTFSLNWKSGEALYFTANRTRRLPIPPVCLRACTSAAWGDYRKILVPMGVPRPASWLVLAAAFLPASLIYPVLRGFSVGRSVRYSGER